MSGGKHTLIFEEIKKVVERIAQKKLLLPPERNSGKMRSKPQRPRGNPGTKDRRGRMGTDCIRITFLNYKKRSIRRSIRRSNDLKLLAVVWSVDRFKHYLLGKEFILAADHKVLISALWEHKSKKRINLGSLVG